MKYFVPLYALKIIQGYIMGDFFQEEMKECYEHIDNIVTDPYQKDRFYKALLINISNKRSNSIQFLLRKYQLAISESYFKKVKYNLCYNIAEELNLLK